MRLTADAILLDNDGVLVASRRQVEFAWTQLAAEFGLDYDTLAGQLVGARSTDTLTRHLSPADTARAVARLEDLEVELASSIRPLAGATELLSQLPDGAWTIVTSASRRLAAARWEAAGITIPADPVTADDVSRGKPDPEPYLVAARRLGVEPERCVVFEDSSSGGAAGLAAGARVVAVGRQTWTTRPLARAADLTHVTAGYDAASGSIEVHIAQRVAAS